MPLNKQKTWKKLCHYRL